MHNCDRGNFFDEFIKVYKAIGEVLGYSIRIEFQSRGTSHAHMLLCTAVWSRFWSRRM